MTSPFFSIFIPKKGNPEYLEDSIESVLRQDFDDFELVVSNNAANEDVENLCSKYLEDGRFIYLEQSQLLSMPDHFDQIVSGLKGKYILMLTERSVMKKGTLKFLHRIIESNENSPDVISWAWDIYYDELKLLVPYHFNEKFPSKISSKDQLLKFAQGISDFPYALPRGLNSCVSADLVLKIRNIHGRVYRTLVPDFSFAYSCLLNTENFIFINSSLFISQGHRISTGGNAVNGDTSEYLNSLNINDPFKDVPFKLPLVQNTIYQDFISTLKFYKRSDIISKWNKVFYYQECFSEIDTKISSGIMSLDKVFYLENQLIKSLRNESLDIQNKVLEKRTVINKVKNIFIRILKKNLNFNYQFIRKFIFLRKRNAIHFENVFDASELV